MKDDIDLIVGMIGAGFWFNAILRVGSMLSSKTGSSQAFNRFRSYVNSKDKPHAEGFFMAQLKQGGISTWIQIGASGLCTALYHSLNIFSSIDFFPFFTCLQPWQAEHYINVTGSW